MSDACETCETQECQHCPENPAVVRTMELDQISIRLLQGRGSKDICRIWNQEMESELQYKGDGFFVEVINL